MSDGDQLVGLVTDRDIVVRAVPRAYPPDARIDSVMSTNIVAVDADAEGRGAQGQPGDTGTAWVVPASINVGALRSLVGYGLRRFEMAVNRPTRVLVPAASQ